MAPTPLTTRLALKPGKRVLIMHAPEGHIETDVNRDTGRDVMADAGWRPVTRIAIDGRWLARR